MVRSTTLVFRGDDLIGQDPRAVTWGVRFCRDDQGMSSRMAPAFERYTVVAFSAEPDLEGNKGIGVYSCCVDHGMNVGWILPDSVPPLSAAQAETVREWLLERDHLAWDHMSSDIRSLLGANDGPGLENGLHLDNPAARASMAL
jgi:hypothetical protein